MTPSRWTDRRVLPLRPSIPSQVGNTNVRIALDAKRCWQPGNLNDVCRLSPSDLYLVKAFTYRSPRLKSTCK
jgi:hypothetical protein